MGAPRLIACGVENLLFRARHLEDLFIHPAFQVPDSLVEHFLHGALPNLASLLRAPSRPPLLLLLLLVLLLGRRPE